MAYRLTLDDVERRVARLPMISGDWEAAHGEEDQLYQDVLEAIAEGTDNAADMAKAALKSREVEFPRYCA